jgi:hypothetical protein
MDPDLNPQFCKVRWMDKMWTILLNQFKEAGNYIRRLEPSCRYPISFYYRRRLKEIRQAWIRIRINLLRIRYTGQRPCKTVQTGLGMRMRINLSCWIRIQEGKNDPQI